MMLVLDNNIFFSLMNPDSANSYLFSLVNVKFIAPEFLKLELNKHKTECLIKSGLSEHEFEMRQKEVEESIEFFKSSEYEKFLDNSLKLISDPNDIDFLALALFKNCAIWSNEPAFKEQSRINVLSTRDMIELLG